MKKKKYRVLGRLLAVAELSEVTGAITYPIGETNSFADSGTSDDSGTTADSGTLADTDTVQDTGAFSDSGTVDDTGVLQDCVSTGKRELCTSD